MITTNDRIAKINKYDKCELYMPRIQNKLQRKVSTQESEESTVSKWIRLKSVITVVDKVFEFDEQDYEDD